MAPFIKGMTLCEGFFRDYAKGILEEYFPNLQYSAGLLGYGSDVLGFDDEVSTDHMWGPRFYLFLSEQDMTKKAEVFRILSENLPYTYKGFSVNFTEPDVNDNGVRHPKLIREGPVNPLIFISTFAEFLKEYLGADKLDDIKPLDWLAFSEHRLLALTSGRFFEDGLNCGEVLAKIRYYPKEVKLYLVASSWDIIASEQAFIKRCATCGDDIGARIICARIAERLMRLCFFYQDTYAPYSKWFGTAFEKLSIDPKIKETLKEALGASDLSEREDRIVKAQVLVAELHNQSGLTEYVDYEITDYYGRDIKVIFAEKFAEAACEELKGTAWEKLPLIGTFSQVGGLSEFSDDIERRMQIQKLYEQLLMESN